MNTGTRVGVAKILTIIGTKKLFSFLGLVSLAKFHKGFFRRVSLE